MNSLPLELQHKIISYMTFSPVGGMMKDYINSLNRVIQQLKDIKFIKNTDMSFYHCHVL